MKKRHKKSRMTLACQSAKRYFVKAILPQNNYKTN